MLFLHTFFCDDDNDNDDNNNNNTTINQVFSLHHFQKMRASLKILETAICNQKIVILEKNLQSDNFDNDDNHDQGVLEKNHFY